MISETEKNQAAEQTAAEDQTAANGTDNGNGTAQADSTPSELEAVRAELQDQKNKYLYLYAEFDNFKKRSLKERSDLVKFGHERLARESLQVADNLERALEHTTNVDALVTGIKMVNTQLLDTLSKFGVVPIKSLGERFNPELHEAVGQEKITAEADGQQEGTVLRELQKGYTIHGRLLRPARVVVAVK